MHKKVVFEAQHVHYETSPSFLSQRFDGDMRGHKDLNEFSKEKDDICKGV